MEDGRSNSGVDDSSEGDVEFYVDCLMEGEGFHDLPGEKFCLYDHHGGGGGRRQEFFHGLEAAQNDAFLVQRIRGTAAYCSCQ